MVRAGAPEPIRTCIGCRTRRPQSELHRIVRTDDQLLVDRSGPGRGAWLCSNDLLACFDRATTSRRWGPAFRASIPANAVSTLRDQLAEDEPEAPDSGP